VKSIDFKRKDSVIRVMSEETKKPKRNWDRVIYVVFLSLVFLFLGYYAVNKIFFIKADGQVLFENVSIRLTDDCRIIAYQREEDDTVKVGDSLFTYTLDKDNLWGNLALGGGITATSYDNEWDWIEKEKYALMKKVALNKIDITESQALIGSYKSEIQRLQNEVVLDVLPKNRLDYVQTEILRLNTAIAKLSSENNQLYGLLKQLNSMLKPSRVKSTKSGSLSGGGNGDEDENGIRVFYSPIDGTVTRVYTRQYEVALKSEQIMAIHKNTPMYVKGFFEQSDLNYFKEGDLVNIEFPDGTGSKGIIKRFYYSTYPLPDEFQKRYEPTTRTIAADIYPVNDNEYSHWRAFYKMSVAVTKFKY
jgi:multidrug resistance efflux pump